ncbi:hypothetical protein SYNTR_0335 [Candidatus Syntrophocurvum alkaliphilum]|uniref:General secretion pathway GspH domain-containing protein n=1 Tax=Candidatus Syntrophocurvum alkaliphilum TaxID=2293317 RepID=A0A6I6DEE7_9FIRM|nr:GspH/FimT family protein [Candidatus Syntrophocurvum alkaliphilum]QGT98928.1 hypothetical protein SYNTR_0335 [Candidatus Syntrophocurvum alkaliphilum]
MITTPSITKTVEFNKLKTDSHEMAALLRLMRQEAITTQHPKTVVFYIYGDRYNILFGESFYLSEDIQFVGETSFTGNVTGNPAVTFLPSGSPNSGGTVMLGNRYDDIMYIIVNPVEGRVRVSNEPPDHWY